jgi:purine-binding chemotaxis protein CheW
MAAAEAGMQVLHFKLCDEHFCMELSHIRQVFPLMALQRVPDSVDYMLGLMNLHGNCIPVLDFALLLRLEHPQPYDVNASAVQCSAADQEVVFIADDLFGVKCVDGKDVQLNKVFNGENPPFLGIVRIGEDMALWLNPDPLLRILSLPEIQDTFKVIDKVRSVTAEPGTDQS